MAKGGEIFILDMGESVRIADLARDLIKLSGFEPDVDIEIAVTGLRPGEKLYEELLLEEEAIKNTKHNKIFVGKPLDLSYSEVREYIKLLENNIGEASQVIELVERMVPTYTRDKKNL